jgi:D-beta-D-heptose 7-phosphate kinase/D-beta-D-heptose 1-phosphate adenosyltransferase
MTLPPLAPERAQAIVAGFPEAHILIVGDAMLDKFIAGRVTRISPEAPVPVVMFDHENYRMGGAANVAHNIAALGAQATLIAVVGQDDAARTLAEACRAAGVNPAFVADPNRPTTTKVRIVTERNQQVARVDYEIDAEVTGDVEKRIVTSVEQRAGVATAIVVSDYLKGCITAPVMRAIIAAGAARKIPVLVDPKIPHIDYYSGATVITPNHHEAEIAANMRIRTDEDARLAARAFRERSASSAVLITRGDQGMWLRGADVEGALPASAREVADVTGAGDTVVAAMTLALSAGANLEEAARIANETAGLAVAKFGAATVSPAELLQALEKSAGV